MSFQPYVNDKLPLKQCLQHVKEFEIVKNDIFPDDKTINCLPTSFCPLSITIIIMAEDNIG